MNTRFEGTLALLAYMLMFVYVFLTVNSEKNVRQILYSIAIVVTLLGILGIFQMFGSNLLFSSIGQFFIVPHKYRDTISITNNLGTMISQTVYNPNYVSLYLTLLVPIACMLFFFYTKNKNEHSIKNAIISLCLFALLILNMAGSLSTSGFIGLALETVTALILLNRKLLSWWKQIVVIFISTIIICMLVPGFRNEIMTSLGYVTGDSTAESESDIIDDRLETVSSIDYIWTDTSKIHMSINDNPFVLQMQRDDSGILIGFDLIDGDNNPLLFNTTDDGYYQTADERFCNVMLIAYSQENQKQYIGIKMADVVWVFVVTKDSILYQDAAGNLIELNPIKYSDFANEFSFAEKRGYIWSRTIPLLKDVVLLGHGADTFAIYFPQNDYAGKYTYKIGVTTLVDKPHNIYLGAIMGTGGISLLALLCIYGMYLWQSIKILKHAKIETFLEYVSVGIFLGVCGFLTAGLLNDSNVSVMPLFYGLLGTGMAVNRLIQRAQNRGKSENIQ